MQNRKKFSLIEMLIVIVVILILISFLVPSIMNMRKKAWEIKCKNRLKQISVLMLLYTGDNEDQFPGDYRGDVFHQKEALMTYGWQGHLAPYLVDLENWNMSNSEYREFRKPYDNGAEGISPLNVFVCPAAAFTLDPYSDSLMPEREIGRLKKKDSNDSSYDGYKGVIPATYFKPYGPKAGNQGGTSGPKPAVGNSLYQTENQYRYNSGSAPPGYGSGYRPYADQKHTTVSEIKDLANKVILVEGDVGGTASTDDYTVFKIGGLRHQITKTFVNGNYGLKASRLNFLHDDIEEFWFSDHQNVGWATAGWNNFYKDFQAKWPENIGAAIHSNSGGTQRASILSYVEPGSVDNFKGKYNGSTKSWVFPFTKYFYEEEFMFMVGDMNVLFADMHVEKKNDGWISNHYSYFNQRD